MNSDSLFKRMLFYLKNRYLSRKCVLLILALQQMQRAVLLMYMELSCHGSSSTVAEKKTLYTMHCIVYLTSRKNMVLMILEDYGTLPEEETSILLIWLHTGLLIMQSRMTVM